MLLHSPLAVDAAGKLYDPLNTRAYVEDARVKGIAWLEPRRYQLGEPVYKELRTLLDQMQTAWDVRAVRLTLQSLTKR